MNLPAPSITQRDIDFGMDADIPQHWMRGECHQTRTMDALSIFFPEGERFFIESVRHYRERIADDAQLNREVRAFIGQEAMHGREHRVYNARLEQQGIPVPRLERGILLRLNLARKLLPKSYQLAITVCLEHFTAILAHQVLSNPDILKDCDPRMQRLWRWHAMEETEHKAVAYDVFLRVVPNPVLRYLLRSIVMLHVSVAFLVFVWVYIFKLVAHDKQLGNWRSWGRALKFMFVNPGTFRKVIPDWLEWFKPGFHPWQHDNRNLLADAQREYDAQPAAA